MENKYYHAKLYKGSNQNICRRRIKGGVASPATSRLFNITEVAGKLKEGKADTFHLVVVKQLWVVKRSRLNIDITMFLICTQVKDPDIHDWVKLRQVLQLLDQTIG